jgi:hypothetical protein
VGSGEPLVGATHTQHSAGRWGYVAALNVGIDKQPHTARVALSDLGEDRPHTDSVAVFDWRNRSVDVISENGAYEIELELAGWDYRVLAPVLPGGVAVIGDPDLYASAGDARIAEIAIEPDGSTVVTMLGTANTSDSSDGRRTRSPRSHGRRRRAPLKSRRRTSPARACGSWPSTSAPPAGRKYTSAWRESMTA